MKEKRLGEKTKITLTIATIIMVILFFIATVYTGTTWKNEVDYKIGYNTNQSILLTDNQGKIELKQIEQEALFAEIKTDLKWIRAALERIQGE